MTPPKTDVLSTALVRAHNKLLGLTPEARSAAIAYSRRIHDEVGHGLTQADADVLVAMLEANDGR